MIKQKSENIKYDQRSIINILMLVFVLVLSSCVQSQKPRRTAIKSASTDTSAKTSTKIPEFKEGSNFIQNGINVFTSSVNFDLSFSDSLQLRGKDVDGYIRNAGTQNVVCLTSRFTSASAQKIIILAAIPRSVYNFTTQTLEYYFNITPADLTTNQSFCQKTGLTNQLFALYPTLTPKYKISELCPAGTCTSTSYISLGLEVFATSGVAITQIATKQLIFNISNNPLAQIPSAQTCTDSSQCTSQGYDCCSLGQCVKDLTLKPGINTSSPDYLQAVQDILNNPANIYLYPDYYFICSQPVNQPEAPPSTTNPVNDANNRLKNLTNLYNCTSKIEGEAGTCTKTYSNAQIGTFYSAGRDDRSFYETFTNLNVSKDSLVSVEEITYGEVVIFNYAQKNEALLLPNAYEDSVVRIEGIHNDDLATGANIKVKVAPTNAVNKDLVIKYKIDASCVQINSSLAKCEKYYIQGQENSGDTTEKHRRGRVTDHYPDSNVFKLPYYANTTKAITVEVDGIVQKQNIDWELQIGAPSLIQFLPVNNLKVFKDQKVRITYFVDLSTHHVMDSKLAALNEIKQICSCADLNCSLTPVKNTANSIVDYACVYPDPIPVEPPISQKIYLSSKTVPVRFFDSNGIAQTTVNSNTLKQEGKEFLYRKDNLLNPSNVTDITNPGDTTDTYTGFNEIYGSLSYTNNSAKPAKEIAVKKGRTYDIYVDRGTFSNCIQCGNDYYSQLNKLFPLTQFGSGASPLRAQTNRTLSNGIRSDDLAFGRACMIPATMIPWTHGTESNNKDQRQNRMRAQHFLFANGYQYDWYGFDYGSVIGSFDGVKWFSIGTNRRIKAESNKMFIAVNGLFGDLTLEATYEVTINDGSLNPIGTNMITTDFDSDGAECQRFHQCSTDNDCVTSLGWDYACSAVNEITTSWPKFDDNAKEIPETSREDNRLVNILGIASTGKRCVYRGRGALCTQNYANVNLNSTFNQSTSTAVHTCSSNNYCQPISTNGTSNAKFNNRIVRYGKVRTDSTIDSFGLGAQIPGRPFSFNGVEPIRSETLKNLNSNKAAALCIPGRELDVDTFLGQHQTDPVTNDFDGDKVLGMGMSLRKNTPIGATSYVASCSILNSSNNFYYNDPTIANSSISGNAALRFNSGTQAISTNALNIFNSIFNTKGITFGLYKNNSTPLTSQTFTENRCMRAPGASCYTDLDCAPSKILSDKIKSLNPDDTTVTNILNKYEVKFWQEELVCSQETAKTETTYDPKNNRCCRDVGKSISLPSGDMSNGIDYTSVPGIDFAMNTSTRYSRVATVYKDTNLDSSNFPALATAIKDQCGPPFSSCASTATLANQFKTFAALGERTSCSGHWVRLFANGSHKWESTRFQTFNSSMFRCLNWLPGGANWTCEGLEEDDPNCLLVQSSPFTAKAKGVFSYLGRLELMGIPQIALESESFFTGTTEGDLSCRSHPADQNNPYPGHPTSPIANYSSLSNLFTGGAIREYSDGVNEYYSGIDAGNFQGMKQVFKADEIATCLPAGTKMSAGADPNLCCTGFINPQNNKCQLLDFVDISIYTNRYVSSEAKKLSSTLFDQHGYIRDPSYVAQLACEKQMCASGVVAFGVLVSRLKTNGQADIDRKFFRFLEGNVAVDNENGILDLYNRGMKINTHAYCAPSSLSGQENADVATITCN